MNDLERLKAALGEPIKREIGGQEFEFIALPIDYIPDLFELLTQIQGNLENIAKRENSQLLVKLIIAMLKESNSFQNADEKDIQRFGMKYFKQLQEIFIELHIPIPDSDKKEVLQPIRNRFENESNKSS
jgi:hypothetical protein